ncbi:MAG: type II secretion system protein [Candidatus Hydrogenedentes bacterium]|nr:type II secretion system protein [Candidatus Hydrogenedentota bacterium]
MTRHPDNNSGMTLIEIMFAMGILATTLSLLFGSLISISIVGRLNEEKAVANTALSSTLEELRGKPLKDLLLYEPQTPEWPGVERTVQLECFDEDGVAIAIPMDLDVDADSGALLEPLPDLPNPLEVKATLLWTNEKGHVFKTYVTTSVGR